MNLGACHTLRILLTITLLNLFLFSYTKTSLAGSPSFSSKEATHLYLFAEELYQTGQYYRALTEYQRFRSYYPDHEMSENVMFKIGLCYFYGEKYEEGAQALEKINRQYPDTRLGKEALLRAAECYRKQGLTAMALKSLEKLTQDSIQEETTIKALYIRGLIFCENNWLDQAVKIFEKIGQNTSYAELSRELINDVERRKTSKKKNPTLAGALAIVPGLGHVYCNRNGDALVAFLINGLFTWGAVESFSQDQNVVGGILAFFELGWYAGNIYSAVGSAHKYNNYQEKTFLDNLEDKIEFNTHTSSESSSSYLRTSFDIVVFNF